MPNELDVLQSEVITALAASPLPHAAKAAILFQEAIAELKTGETAGEFTSRQHARLVWDQVAGAIRDSASA